jgi:hypothetical protein
MQRPTLRKMPMVRVMAVSLPPMYTWPIPVKRVILGLGIMLCIGVYEVMGTGLVRLMSLVSGLI